MPSLNNVMMETMWTVMVVTKTANSNVEMESLKEMNNVTMVR